MRSGSLSSVVRTLLAATGLGVAALVPAFGQSCDQLPDGSTEFIIQNRATMLCMGGSCPRPALEELGRFQIDGLGHRASMRMTSSVNKTVSSVWLYITAVKGAPGPLRVSVKGELDGLPVPDEVEETVIFTPTVRGWIEIPFAPGTRKQIQTCEVIHVEIAPLAGPYNSTNFVELVTVVNRFPLMWQAQVPGQASSQAFLDFQLAFLFDDEGGDGLTPRWDDGNLIYAPVFLLQCTDGSTLGQPYSDHLNSIIVGNSHWGQSFIVDPALANPVHLNYVATFIRGRGLGQSDNLYAYLYDPLSNSQVPDSETLLIDPPGVINRSHWFGALLNGGAGVDLVPGREYYLMFRSDSMGVLRRGYDFSSERTTVPLMPGIDDPTYGGIQSRVVSSPDGGNSFFASAGKADTAFRLGNLADPQRAVGTYDEGVVLKAADGSPAHTVGPGELVKFHIETRNIGVVTGDLFVNLVDHVSGQSILATPTIAPNVGPNKDDNSTIAITVSAPNTAGAWRVEVQVGAVLSPGNYLVEDAVQFEIRVE